MEMSHPTLALLTEDAVAAEAITSLDHEGVPPSTAVTPALMPTDAHLIQTLFGLSHSGGLENPPCNLLLQWASWEALLFPF